MKFAYTKQSLKSLSKLDKITQKRIMDFTQELESLENPRIKGKALKRRAKRVLAVSCGGLSPYLRDF